MQKLKPNTSYSFTEKDYQFAIELAKIGSIHFLSSQITLKSDKGKPLSFNEYGSDENDRCDGLQLPSNWLIEFVSSNDGETTITFKIQSSRK